jgi:hypothetical protein
VSEPFYIAQCGDEMTEQERWARLERTVEDANTKGSVFGRVTRHPDFPNLILFEGWKERPEDQGEPRFQMVSLAPVSSMGESP